MSARRDSLTARHAAAMALRRQAHAGSMALLQERIENVNTRRKLRSVLGDLQREINAIARG